MRDTNVGIGMVACRPKCQCSDCQIERLTARVQELESDLATSAKSEKYLADRVMPLEDALREVLQDYKDGYPRPSPTLMQQIEAALVEAEHKHTDACWEPDSGCDMGRNEKYVARAAEGDKP